MPKHFVSSHPLVLGTRGQRREESGKRKSLLRKDITIESYEDLLFIELLIGAVERKWCSREIVCRHDVFLFGAMADRTATGSLPWQLPVSQSPRNNSLPFPTCLLAVRIPSVVMASAKLNKEHSGPIWVNVAVSFCRRQLYTLNLNAAFCHGTFIRCFNQMPANSCHNLKPHKINKWHDWNKTKISNKGNKRRRLLTFRRLISTIFDVPHR